MRKTLPAILALVTVLLLVLSACTTPTSTPLPTSTPRPTSTPVPGAPPTPTPAPVTPTTAPTPTPVVKPVTLRVAEFQAATNIISINGPQFFMKEVEKATGGRVKFDFFPSEQLLKANDAPDGVAKGIADIGNMTYISGKIPILGLAQVPGVFSDEQAAAASSALWKVIKGGYIEQEFLKLGLKPLWCYAIPNYQILTVKKPVKTLADLAGLKLRTAGVMLPKAIEAAGAISVSIPAAEAYDALERGTMDGSTLTMSSLPAQPWAELIKYVTVNANLGGLATSWAMNKATWDSLPADIQRIMQEVGDRVPANATQAMIAEQVKLVEEWKGSGKVEALYLSDADRVQLAEKMKPAADAWIADMDGKGAPASQLLQQWKAAIQAEAASK